MYKRQQSPLWAKADAIYHRSNQGGGEWEYRRRLPEKWKISCGEGEDKLTLIVSPTGFKHTGVFPEQAVNWAWYQQKIRCLLYTSREDLLTVFSGSADLKPLSRCATAPPRGSKRPPAAPRFRRKRHYKCRLPLRPLP